MLAADADLANEPPRVVLTLTGATGTQVTIRRSDDQGNTVTVRAADPAALVAGGALVFDYEAPYGVPVTYTATMTGGATITSVPVTLDPGRSWLIHPGIPDLSVPLEVAQMPTVTRASNRGLFQVLGRAEAVARSDGQRKARAFDLTVRTYTSDDQSSLDALLDDDSVLLLQIADPRIYHGMYAWVSCGDLSLAPMATYAEGWVEWTLPCTESARPSGLLQSQRTWADVIAENATWADVIAKYATWRDLILDNQSTVSADVVSGGGGGTSSGGGVTIADHGAYATVGTVDSGTTITDHGNYATLANVDGTVTITDHGTYATVTS